ncbi:MAG: T9SS type A sorting domain-containing protein [Bacteroidia bacterium]
MSKNRVLLSLAVAASVCSGVYARENIGTQKPAVKRAMAAGCAVDAGAAYMAINNVRARIMDEGDMFWDPGAGLPRYYVPATGQACSDFAGALWVGGVDAGGQLKVAAMTYRQNGEDFWAGPIYPGFTITASECLQWDKLFYVTRQEVENWVALASTYGTPTSDIANWPGNDPWTGGGMLAPYIDVNGDGTYDPGAGVGDYPAYDLAGTSTTYKNQIFGDATLWWVINDIGNAHTESGGISIGLEVHEQCFAFQTNDAVNNMTFYNLEIINKSTYQVNNCYMSPWNDVDLGNGDEDYVGCDVGRNMGYQYKGDQPYDADGSGNFAGEIGYHGNLPAIGQVFFQGPVADKGDKHCYVETVDSQQVLGMAKFVYYNNDFTVQGNPTKASDYYNYLRGIWEDGSPMTYGGNGYQTSSVPASYMFCWTPGGACSSSPVNTDPKGCGTNGVAQTVPWDEIDAGDKTGDRRFMQSSGPFTLAAGAVNYVTYGLVWDQPPPPGNGSETAPICLIQSDADLAQALFNSHFRVLEGPAAPDMQIQELNHELIITLSNQPPPAWSSANNFDESYNQQSPTIVGFADNTYKFEGYEIFQVVDSSVTTSSITPQLNTSQARLVAGCEVQNGVGQITNWLPDGTTGTLEAVPMVAGGLNSGIKHSFDITTDLFQEDGISTLVNDRPYYYLVVAYAYNNYLTYNPQSATNGQQLPFLLGSKNVKVYVAYPQNPSSENGGTIQNSNYGTGLPITRLEGHGNGANELQMDQNSLNYILQHDTMAHPSYLPGYGPITVKVVDPLSVVDANFVLKIMPHVPKGPIDGLAAWQMEDVTRGLVFISDVAIANPNEQIFPQYGISVTISQVPYPSGSYDGVIDSACTISFSDNTKEWFTFVPSSAPGSSSFFWIRSGNNIDRDCSEYTNTGYAFNSYPNDIVNPTSCPAQYQGPLNTAGLPLAYFYDKYEYYNQILGGGFAPFTLCAESDAKLYCDNGPGYGNGQGLPVMDSIANIASVDIVITSDQTKWTRCVVFEMQDETELSEGNAVKFQPRASESIDKNGNFATAGSGYSSNPDDPNYISERSMGWFPGYAINIETGERLNMAYGEDSWLAAHNGRDMKWNPDSILVVADANGLSGASKDFGTSSVFGGKHYIYVFAHNNNQLNSKYNIPFYDKDSTIMQYLTTGTPPNTYKSEVLGDIMWAGIPLLKAGHSLLESDVTLHLRVTKPYDTGYGSTTVNSKIKGSTWRNPNPQNGNYPMYSFTTNPAAVTTNDAAEAKSALSLINIVPNPYYAYSDYETGRLDTRVRITNLPNVCTITIFTLNGELVQVINKNSPVSYVDWNLQNQYSIPISSGMYIIHVAVPDVGEVTLKWLGVMRPTDLNSY